MPTKQITGTASVAHAKMAPRCFYLCAVGTFCQKLSAYRRSYCVEHQYPDQQVCTYVNEKSSTRCPSFAIADTTYCRRHRDTVDRAQCLFVVQSKGTRCTRQPIAHSNFCERHAFPDGFCTFVDPVTRASCSSAVVSTNERVKHLCSAYT
jgi:hypothetical protein